MPKIEVEQEHLFRAVLLLDAALEALDAAAEREKRREAGKSLRNITEQQRAETVREFLTEMEAEYGVAI